MSKPEAAMPGDVEALLAILRSHARSLERDDPEQALRCRGVTNYRIVPLTSSGPMEKGVDITVCRRFKTRGMSWFRKGVSHLLHLKLLRLNGTWDRLLGRPDGISPPSLACRSLSVSTEN